MTNLRKIIVILAVIVGILCIFAVIRVVKDDYSLYPKVFYEYKEKGKETQSSLDDVRKGFK